MEAKCRSVFFYRHYFEEFFEKQNPKVKKKILWTLKLIEEVQFVPETYLKHLSGMMAINIKKEYYEEKRHAQES